MSAPTRSPVSPLAPRKKKGFGRGVVTFALLIAVLFALTSAMELFWTRLDQRLHPWGYAGRGHPALVGTWIGTLETAGGIRRPLLLDIQMVPAVGTSSRGRSYVRRTRDEKLQGETRMCAAAGDVRAFSMHGDTDDDKAASRFHFGLYPADSVPRDGLAPSHLRGRWDGRDALTIEADIHMRKGEAAITSSDDPNTGRPAQATMRRGAEAEFRASCGRT
jgi:hypothetical protein